MNNNRKPSPIAIIGLASIFPQAANLQEYWDNILQKVNAIIDVPETHWLPEDYYDPEPTTPDKVYAKRGGFLPEVDFDPLEYGLPPNILEVTDTSQLLSLVVAKDALLDAGYFGASDEIRERTGVVLGVGGGQKLVQPLVSRLQYPVWRKILRSAGVAEDEIETLIEKMKLAYVRWEENSFPGLLGNVVTGRIANRFDLGGINTVLDAACASSLSALQLAVNELALGNADMMITGGVDTDNSIFMYMCFSKTPAFAKGDNPRPFDSKSDGMMVGEGIGMFVLKRLEDAERDGDRIYAVIKSVGSSSDGRFKSIYAPRSEGQELALRRAYERAGFSPETVGLIEAHGTGTVAGDITETNTLVRYLSSETDRENIVALGSVKSQIGHTKAAAGAAGLIKAALALHHQVLPPMINIEEPNPKLNLEGSPLYINTEARPWVSPNGPRRAGVSAFGFGGTNFHVVLEEYTGKRDGEYRLHTTPQLILIPADSPYQLADLVQTYITGLEGEDANAVFNQLGKDVPEVPLNAARVGFVAESAEEAAELLHAAHQQLTNRPDAEHWEHPKGIYYRKTGMPLKGRVVALFSGQGSQYANMGSELAINFPQMRAVFQAMDAEFDPSVSLSNVVYPPTKDMNYLNQTEFAQPAIGAMSAGLFNILRDAGFEPDFAAGHSFGELTALWAAGAINDEDYYRLARARGKAMAPQSTAGFDPGTMLAVTGDLTNLSHAIAPYQGVVMANFNSPKQVVLAGPTEALNRAKEDLANQGYNVVPLSVSAAFHTSLVGHAQRPFAEAINQARFNTPRIPVYSNATGTAYPTDPTAIRQQIADHILQPVKFQDEIENLYNAGGYLFVEFGPRNILTNLVKEILKDKPHVAVSLNSSRRNDSDHQFRNAVAQLCVLGLPLAGFDPYTRRPVEAPAPKRKGLNVKLNGANYVSDKTRKAFQDALNDGFKLTRDVEVQVEVPQIIQGSATPTEAATPAAATPTTSTAAVPSANGSANTSDAVGRGMAIFEAQQREMMDVHEKYIANQTEYFRLVAQLTEQQQKLIATGDLSSAAIENLNQHLARLHDYQAETLRIHEQYLQQQTQGLQDVLKLMGNEGSNGYVNGAMTMSTSSNGSAYHGTSGNGNPLVPAKQLAPPVPVAATAAPIATTPAAPAPVASAQPAPASPAPSSAPANGAGISMDALSEALMEIIAEKTGYPSDVLDLSMDMESDLGIDSIKRVEILGAMREKFPQMPTFNADDLTELRTLQEIVDYMAQVGGGDATSVATASAAPAQPAPAEAITPAPALAPQTAPASPAPASPAPSTKGAGISMEALSAALMEIIAEKTGYPADVLDLSMDMESDLGIDSIKRVEILGAMREKFPQMPTFNADDLTELRTLQEIVDYMAQVGGGAATSVVTASAALAQPAPTTATAPVAPAQLASASPAPSPAPANGTGISMDALSDALMEIIAEKTGYPADVLELSMDMESDLGIDSIKRVEILGAMREKFPQMPTFNADDLTELRTLQEIVDYMAQVGGGNAAEASAPIAPATPAAPAAPVQPVAASANGAGIDMDALSEALMEIIAEKTGYPADVLELSMDMESDLGIDSIKRVEILGAMREKFPQMPTFNADDLTELRTLQEIVDYMYAQVADQGVQSSDFFPVTPDGANSTNESHTPARVAPPRVDYDVPRSVVNLRYLPRPDQIDYDLLPGAVCLVTDDGTAFTNAVAQGLKAKGWRVVVLSFPANIVAPSTQVDAERITLTDTSEDALKTALASINGPIQAFVHLNPALQSNGLFTEAEKAIVKQVFLLAKHLKPQLTTDDARRSFMTVTHMDGKLGLEPQTLGSAISGGLFGLTKTLKLEWPTVFCRAVDIARETDAQQAAGQVIAELYDPNLRLVEIGYSATGRYTLTATTENVLNGAFA